LRVSTVAELVEVDRRPERDEREGDEHRRQRHDRCQREQEPRRPRRDEVLLEQHLQRIGDEVEDAPGAEWADVGAVRPEAVLHHRALAPLGPREQRGDRHDEEHDQPEPLHRAPQGLPEDVHG
jgi:hypothetical protein